MVHGTVGAGGGDESRHVQGWSSLGGVAGNRDGRPAHVAHESVSPQTFVTCTSTGVSPQHLYDGDIGGVHPESGGPLDVDSVSTPVLVLGSSPPRPPLSVSEGPRTFGDTPRRRVTRPETKVRRVLSLEWWSVPSGASSLSVYREEVRPGEDKGPQRISCTGGGAPVGKSKFRGKQDPGVGAGRIQGCVSAHGVRR